jgi:serine/threonine protein kinase
MSLAIGGQILLTRFPFDEARHFMREHPAISGSETPKLRWLAHGPYLLKGRDEPMEIFEVGAENLAPLMPPPDSEKAKRVVRHGEEGTLGWRPALGLEIPSRPDWKLVGKLGAGGFGEVWAGEHTKLRQRRAFKFCFDDERLRALKREVTLVKLLRSALGDREDIVQFHELKLDAPPFYLESDLAPHGNLLQWAEKRGGLKAIPLDQRIVLVAHTASALAAAHSIGVLL